MNDAIVRLAEHHTLSLISARLLDAALATGRNVLCTGPLTACMPLMTALVAEGDRPGFFSAHVYAPEGDAAAAGSAVGQASEGGPASEGHRAAAPDRLAAWQPQPQAVAQALLHHVGVVGHLAAGRLDRCLMRLELALMPHAPGAAPALAVLAAVDLVVVVASRPSGRSQVESIYELVMAEDGYRPAPLFVCGTAAAAETLLPVRSPTFTAHLAACGHGALAEELQAAAPAADPRAPQPGWAEPMHAGHGAKQAAESSPEAPTFAPAASARPPRRAPSARPARPTSAPGWELDQEQGLPAPEGPEAEAAESFAEHLAALTAADKPDAAATADDGPVSDEPMGLEPPPKPHV